MDQKEKLTKLILEAPKTPCVIGGSASGRTFQTAENIAAHLLANGFVDFSHVNLLEIDEDYGSFQVPKVILYNENHVTQEEALRVVRAGDYHPSVLTLPKRQWESLFLNRKED